MEKTKVILVVLGRKNLGNALRALNYDKVSPYAALMDGGGGKSIKINDKLKIQLASFGSVNQLVAVGQNFLWLICGGTGDIDAFGKMKNFLATCGVPEKNIINFGWLESFGATWTENLQAVENGNAHSFATGDELIARGLNFENLPDVKGVNLAAANQDLRQSFLIAQHIFKRVKRGAIKFVFIGLSPYSLRVDTRKNFSTCADDLKYALALRETFKATNTHDRYLAAVLGKDVKNIFQPAKTDKPAQIPPPKDLSAADLANWQDELARLTKTFDEATVENNLRVLEDYVKLCVEHGANPVGILFPFAEVMRKNYSREILLPFRRELQRLEKIYNFAVIDMFDAPADYDCFGDVTNLNAKGAAAASTTIDFRLRGKDFLPLAKISRLNYQQIFNASNFLSKDDFNDTLEKYFRFATKKIRGKKKIHIGFVSDDPSMWCGDELYHRFADNHRCETTFFLCLQKSLRDQPLSVEDFKRGLEEFKSRGINVIGVEDDEQTCPAQDVLIMLRPYFHYLPKAFALSSIGAETLTVYIPYGFNTSAWDVCDTPIHRFGWKLFFESREHVNRIAALCREGAPRCHFSGYTKLDVFYKNSDALTFDWKMARPDAKKIIYAPHWSIASGIFYSTFKHNYKFMLQFAKEHPEISWVIKPHPMLLATAVGHGLFKSADEFKAYLQAWDDLPNAKVFTGAYYQGLFATSDGMIMDCGSFIGEYQYTHKPLIFLTRNTQKFNSLGDELMKFIYRVDGKNLQGIAALMTKIFINGEDDMFDARKKFFDERLDYVKANGMTAGEFIFKTLAKDLGL